jgi:hypothetical protein
MSNNSSDGAYVMCVEAAIAARSILCSAGATASDAAAAAPAFPRPGAGGVRLSAANIYVASSLPLQAT